MIVEISTKNGDNNKFLAAGQSQSLNRYEGNRTLKLLGKYFWATAFVATIAGTTTYTAAVAGEVVTIDNFTRAESDFYFQKRADAGYFGKLVHLRETVDVNNQPVVRANRDTLYSYGVFDLTEPVTIEMPEHADRFQSLRVINQDHYVLQDSIESGSYTFTQESVGSRYMHANVRTLVNPDNAADIDSAHALQNQVFVTQSDAGALELPDWDQKNLAGVRKAVLGMSPYVPNSFKMFGAKDTVDEVRHLIGTAGGWGGGSEEAVLFVNVAPDQNDGKILYILNVGDVPVDGFWSISLYNADGFFEPNDKGGYSLNNLMAKPNDDGSFAIRFGGDPKADNFLNIMAGWNYTVRMYLPRKEVIYGSWTFPGLTPME